MPRVKGSASNSLSMSGHRTSYELDTPRGKQHHLEQQPTVPPALDIGRAVSSPPVTDGYLNDSQIQFGSAEQQIEIAKGVKVPKILPVFRDTLIVILPQHFGPAESVFNRPVISSTVSQFWSNVGLARPSRSTAARGSSHILL